MSPKKPATVVDRDPTKQIEANKNHAVLLPIDNHKTTEGGIVIPDKKKRGDALRARVVAVPAQKFVYGSTEVDPDEPTPNENYLDLKAGDVVLFSSFDIRDLMTEQGVSLICIPYKDIIAVIERAPRKK